MSPRRGLPFDRSDRHKQQATHTRRFELSRDERWERGETRELGGTFAGTETRTPDRLRGVVYGPVHRVVAVVVGRHGGPRSPRVRESGARVPRCLLSSMREKKLIVEFFYCLRSTSACRTMRVDQTRVRAGSGLGGSLAASDMARMPYDAIRANRTYVCPVSFPSRGYP